MASDRIQFERALERWEELHNDRAYSVPIDIGKTAIVVSFDETFSSTETEKREFTKEAQKLAASEQRHGRDPEVLLDASGSDIKSVLRDPSIANIVTIGHGALSYIYISNGTHQGFRGHVGEANNRYDWRNVSRDADHLKSGYFVQRHCGNAVRKLSVPLGSFAMTAHNSVLASVNTDFNPVLRPRSIWSQLSPLPSSRRLSYYEVKGVYPYNV
jgi:hypothetical protein